MYHVNNRHFSLPSFTQRRIFCFWFIMHLLCKLYQFLNKSATFLDGVQFRQLFVRDDDFILHFKGPSIKYTYVM